MPREETIWNGREGMENGPGKGKSHLEGFEPPTF